MRLHGAVEQSVLGLAAAVDAAVGRGAGDGGHGRPERWSKANHCRQLREQRLAWHYGWPIGSSAVVGRSRHGLVSLPTTQALPASRCWRVLRLALLREALTALLQRESARRLARLGGTERALKPIPRRRTQSR